MITTSSDRNLLVQLLLLELSLYFIVVLQTGYIFVDCHVPAPLKTFGGRNAVVVQDFGLDLVYYLTLLRQLLLFGVINKAQFDLQVLLEIVLLVEIESVLVLKECEGLLLVNY